jgi:hypothetical protein
MLYFKDAAGLVYARMFASNAHEGFIPISEAEALALAAAQTPEVDLIEQERRWRDDELLSVIWLRDRHRDQLEIGGDTTLTNDRFAELLLYMQALRDWPQSPDFPQSQHRPIALDWIAEQVQ